MNNQAEVVQTLELVHTTCQSCQAEYRVVGSTLLAALVGRVYRLVPDVDVLLEVERADFVLDQLEHEGFSIHKQTLLGSPLFTCRKKGYTDISLLGLGTFTPDYFSLPLRYGFSVKIPRRYIAPTLYQLGRVTFIGIPIEGVAPSVIRTAYKPVRQIDIEQLSKVVQLNDYATLGIMHLYFRNQKIPWIYDWFVSSKNLVGKVRLFLGKPYELSK